MTGTRLALEGIRVIDLTQWVAGPEAACLLAQWGAEVIHIEHPLRGDGTRGVQTGSGAGKFHKHPMNYSWELPNMNKKSLTADLDQEEGREIIYRLVAKSDVFLSVLRPREVEKFAVQYERLKGINPRLIYANITGYGTEGPARNDPGYDNGAYFARTGMTYMLSEPGQEPVWSRPALGDFPTAMVCACGIMVALFARERLGIGQQVHTSLFNAGIWALSFDTQGALLTHQDIDKERRVSAPNPLNSFYKTRDGRWIRLSHLQPDPYWPGLCRAMRRESLEKDPRFDSFKKRTENNAALIEIMDEAFAERTLDEWKAELARSGLIFSTIQKPSELASDPQARANGFFPTFNHPTYGPVEMVAAPVKLSETPGTFRTPAPELGQHTEEILLELGYTWEDVGRLKEKKVIA